jgi:hypothetical protein
MSSITISLLLFVAVPRDDGAAKQGGEERVRVTVIAILATDKNARVDPRLECIAKEIQKKDPNLTGFQLAQTSNESCTVGKATKFELVDKETAEVIVRHGANKEDRVCLKVKPPRMGEITYTSTCGKFFPILTRYQTKNHERLLSPSWSSPANRTRSSPRPLRASRSRVSTSAFKRI